MFFDKPAVTQLEINPRYQQKKSEDFPDSEGVQMETWSPLAIATGDIFHNSVLASIAKKYSKSTAQVVLRWLNKRNIVIIPKSIHKKRIIENLNIYDFTLSEDQKELKRILVSQRLI